MVLQEKVGSYKGDKIMQSAKLIGAVSIALFLLAPTVSAEELYIRNGFWGGIDAGAGVLTQSFDEGDDEDDIAFYLGFKGGYAVNPHLLIGLEAGGWLLEASDFNEPDEGKGISQVFFITQLYPGKESGFFAKAGGGYVSMWSNRPDDTRREQGWGLTLGGGYDLQLNEAVALSPFVNFNYGEAGNWDYSAITFGIGVTFP
jgi:hypothetical protein